MKNGTRDRTITVKLGHPRHGDETLREGVSEQVASIADVTVLYRVINIRDDRDARWLDQLQPEQLVQHAHQPQLQFAQLA